MAEVDCLSQISLKAHTHKHRLDMNFFFHQILRFFVNSFGNSRVDDGHQGSSAENVFIYRGIEYLYQREINFMKSLNTLKGNPVSRINQ